MPATPSSAPRPAETARGLLRSLDRAALGTLRVADGAPHVSLVLVAVDADGAPILLLSRLAEHTRNLLAALERDGSAPASLLFDGTAGLDDPLTGPRVTLNGLLAPSTLDRHRRRYLARHPSAALYADFSDFAFYHLAPTQAHLVAGFGAIHTLDAEALLDDVGDAAALLAAAPDIVAHMNEDHADAIALIARHLLGQGGDGWRMTGIDPEGCDLRLAGAVARVRFAERVTTPQAARVALVALTRQARSRQAGT